MKTENIKLRTLKDKVYAKCEEILVVNRVISDILDSVDKYSGEYDHQLENLFDLLYDLEEIFEEQK